MSIAWPKPHSTRDAKHTINFVQPKHKDDMCEITDMYKTHLPDEEKRKYEMISHEQKVIKSIHLQNDYIAMALQDWNTNNKLRQQQKHGTSAWKNGQNTW